MKGFSGFAALSILLLFYASCVTTPVSAPEKASEAASGSAPDTPGVGEQGTPVAEVSSPAELNATEGEPVLAEAPQLFPEASPAPVEPALTRKTQDVTLPSPEATALLPVKPATETGPQNSQTGQAKPESKPTGTTSPQTATAQKDTASGSAPAAAEKKAAPVDSKTLKAAEPKPDSSTVKEVVPVPPSGLPELPSKTNPALAEERVVLSRSVRATLGQLVEIPYQGAGWVYLGEVGGRKGLAYDSRRLDPDGQTFVFRCEAPGTYTVKFFKQDFIKDYIINDYVEVVVGESPVPATSGAGVFSLPVDRGRVVANPRWPIAGAAATTATTNGTTNAATANGATPAAATAATPAAPTTTAAPTGTAAQTSTAATTTPATGANNAASPATATTAPAASTAPATTATTAPANAAATMAAAATTGTAQPVTAPTATTNGATTATAASPTTANTATSTTPATSAAATAAPAGTTQTTAANPSLDNLTQPEEFINLAKTQMDAGQYASTLATLQAFSARYPAGSDEAWWLMGQALEAKGPQRDIKGALSYYKRLLSEYPQSRHYDEAQQRIAYLERFYFDIR